MCRPAVDALLRIVEYLRAHTVPNQAAHSLLNEQPTFAMAAQFAQQDQRLSRICQEEQEDANARVKAHHDTVSVKQNFPKSVVGEGDEVTVVTTVTHSTSAAQKKKEG